MKVNSILSKSKEVTSAILASDPSKRAELFLSTAEKM